MVSPEHAVVVDPVPGVGLHVAVQAVRAAAPERRAGRTRARGGVAPLQSAQLRSYAEAGAHRGRVVMREEPPAMPGRGAHSAFGRDKTTGIVTNDPEQAAR